jgi:phage replication initiation protein
MKFDTPPPPTNRGALNTNAHGLRSLVDWFQVTYKDATNPREIIEILGLNPEDFVVMEKGLNGWSKHLRFGEIAVYYDAKYHEGCHLIISGQGCRQVEELTSHERVWENVCRITLSRDVSIPRLDSAIDDFGQTGPQSSIVRPHFKVPQIIRMCKENRCRSKFEWGRGIEAIKLGTGEVKGSTLNVGSGSSRIQVRFYEKNYERENKGFTLDEDITVWNRIEIQARDERAFKMAQYIADAKPIGEMIQGILKDYINFVDYGINEKGESDTNKSRWRVSRFWTKFLDNVEKLSLTNVAPDKTLEKSHNWIENQTSRTLGMISEALDDDEWLVKLAKKARANLKEKDLIFVNKNREKFKKHMEFLMMLDSFDDVPHILKTKLENELYDPLRWDHIEKMQIAAHDRKLKHRRLRDLIEKILASNLSNSDLSNDDFTYIEAFEDEINDYYGFLKREGLIE